MRRVIHREFLDRACADVGRRPVEVSPTVSLRASSRGVEVWDVAESPGAPVAVFPGELILDAVRFLDQQAGFPEAVGAWESTPATHALVYEPAVTPGDHDVTLVATPPQTRSGFNGSLAVGTERDVAGRAVRVVDLQLSWGHSGCGTRLRWRWEWW
ncbi:MAG: hypothetical protein AB2A00_06130 [Myxococcota bacterium]